MTWRNNESDGIEDKAWYTYIFKEDLENTTSLFIDDQRYAPHCKMTNSRLCNTCIHCQRLEQSQNWVKFLPWMLSCKILRWRLAPDGERGWESTTDSRMTWRNDDSNDESYRTQGKNEKNIHFQGRFREHHKFLRRWDQRCTSHLLDVDVVVQDLAVMLSTTLSSPCSRC